MKNDSMFSKDIILTMEDFYAYQNFSSRKISKLNSLIGIIVMVIYFLNLLYNIIVPENSMIRLVNGVVFILIIFTLLISSKLTNKILNEKENTNKSLKLKYTFFESYFLVESEHSENKIYKDWIKYFNETENYIFLSNELKSAFILPKKYFSQNELVFINTNFQL